MQELEQKTNLKVAYFLAFISEMFFPIAVWLFFYSHYLDFKQIAIMTAVGGVAGILLEIPTGAFADIFGRKTSIIISYFLFSASMIGVAYTQSFWIFLMLAVIGALVNALYSGSLEALIYDTLKENNQVDQYDHIVSRIEAVNWIGLFVGSILGGFMYQYWFRLPYLAQAGVTFIAAVAAFFLHEPDIDSKKYHFADFFIQNTKGFRELFHDRIVSRFSVLFIILGAGYHVASSILGISQAEQYGMTPQTVGILFATGYILSAVVSYGYPYLKKYFGTKLLFFFSVVALLSSFVLANFVGVMVGAGLIILRIASSTTFRNTRSMIMNRYLSSQNRATALSTVTLLSQLPFAVMAYTIGDVIDKTSPNFFALYLGGVIIVLLFLSEGFFFAVRKRS